MKDLFNNALSEISDRHIEEAAVYTPQKRTINLFKLLPIAACLIVLIVGAITLTLPDVPTNITSQSHFQPPDSSSATVAGNTGESTTVAGVPPINTTAACSTPSAETTEIRLFCTAPMEDYTGWENIPFNSFYHCINIGDAYYYAAYVSEPSAYTAEPLAKEQLGELLYEFSRSDYRFPIDGSGDFIVGVYELNGYPKDEAVAVGRKDGLMKGYYAYYRETNQE